MLLTFFTVVRMDSCVEHGCVLDFFPREI